ncbi:MAG TPA: DNA repair protein RecO, partial [Gemmatimonadetes bacterium]|nr:DNA repair protein RecO [Gemmatimonadota bacterium]
MAPVSTPAVLLRSHDYGDSSRILRFYTETHGLLSVMAR